MTIRTSIPPDHETPPTTTRRGFLDALLSVGFIGTLAAVLYPVWRYLNPPPRGEPPTASVVAGPLADLPPNSGKVFRFGAVPALVVRTPDGELRAFNAICTHLDCTVQYRPETAQIWCACHNGMFDLGGNVVSGPPPRPLEPLTVNVRGDRGQEEVVVSRG
jgi:cytochrome b6-f complex iron-sulfur subunit